MNLLSVIFINGYSILILIILLHQACKHTDNGFLPHRLFRFLIYGDMIVLFVDIFSRFDGYPETYYAPLNAMGNYAIFLLGFTLPSLWLLYAHYQVFRDEKRTRKLYLPLGILNAVNMFTIVISQFYGWFYYIDAGNIYHRGPYFIVIPCIVIVLMLGTLVMILVNRVRIEKRHFFALVFYSIPPFASVFFQVKYYGVSLMPNSIVLSLLIVFFSIQNRNLNTDFLTGVYNRKMLETHLKECISKSSDKESFSAIMLDLNDFKQINDTFGHDLGDDALITFTGLLRTCLQPVDFVARFGGDEFYVILELSDTSALEDVTQRILHRIDQYNQHSLKPYKLGVSMGYAVYEHASQMSAEAFQKKIDQLLYESKRVNKELHSNF